MTIRPIFRVLPTGRLLSTTARQRALPAFSSGPAPPRLPKEEQEIFNRLQSSSTGAFSTPKTTVVVNQSPAPISGTQINRSSETESPVSQDAIELAAVNARIQATGDGEEVHPDVRRGPKPEFEGDRNPKTGETGGPKNEPLRWGGNVDWSYNGRVTDF